MNQRCEDMRSLFDSYMNGGLKRKRRAVLEDHLASCDACRRALAGEREVAEALESLPVMECPDRVVEKIERAAFPAAVGGFARARKRRHGFQWATVSVGLAAAAVAALMIVGPFGGGDETEKPEFSEEEALSAREKAKWSLGYIADVMNRKEKEVIEDVFLKELPMNVRKSLKHSIPILKGGRDEDS